MKELGAIQSAIFAVGGLLMVVGMGAFVFMFHQLAAAIVFLVGAVLFAAMQCMQTYQGTDFTIRRLKSLMNMADLLFVLTGVLMVDTASRFLRPLFPNFESYVQYVYNKWFVLLIVAVVLELYTTHRITYELRKQAKKEE